MNTRRNNSIKRRAIYDALCATKEHPTAEMLFSQLKEQYPQLSLATVYRNLQVLTQEGLAIKVAHVDGQERYDGRVEPHAHLVCRGCTRVVDLEIDEDMEGIMEIAADSGSFTPESFQLSITGLCQQCRE